MSSNAAASNNNSNNAVLVEICIVSTLLQRKNNYLLLLQLDKPAPAQALRDPGSKKAVTVTSPSADTSIVNKVRTDIVYGTVEPKFTSNIFAFNVPTTIVSNNNNNSSSQRIIGNLTIELCTVADSSASASASKPTEKVIAKSVQAITDEINDQLFTGQVVPLMLQLTSSTNDIEGEVYLEMKLAQDAHKTVDELPKFKNTGDSKTSKITQLIQQLRESSEVHLKILEETNKMKNSKLTSHLEELGNDMKQKRIVIERFIAEMQFKNEQLDIFKKQYNDQVVIIKKLQDENAQLKQQVDEHVQWSNAAQKDNKLYAKYLDLKQHNEELEQVKKRHEELLAAHTEQNAFIQKMHKRNRALKKYKLVAQKQENVIQKLEKLLEQAINSNYQISLHKGIVAAPAAANKAADTYRNELEAIKRDIQEEKQKNSSSSSDEGNDGNTAADISEYVSKIAKLERELQDKQTLVQKLEAEKDELTKRTKVAELKAKRIEDESMNIAREVASLKMKMAMMASGSGSSGSNVFGQLDDDEEDPAAHMTEDDAPAAVKPKTPLAEAQSNSRQGTPNSKLPVIQIR